MILTEKPYFRLTGGWLTFWVSVACATDMTLFGYDQGVFSGVVVTPDFLQAHDLVGPTKTKILSTVTAIYDVGCFFGAMLAFTAGERLGRKKTILLGCTITAIGTILKASSYSLAQMFVGRVVLGTGNGLSTATAPVWQTETAQAKWRGKLVILELGLNVGGYCLLCFIIVLFATIPWLPESPRWLLSHNRDDEALEVLACIEALDSDDPYIRTQYDEIKYSIGHERDNAIRWRDLVRRNRSDGTKTLRRLLLGASTQAIQQFQGINIMSYYLPTVMITSVGLSNSMARLLTACNATSYFVFSCINSLPMRTKGAAVATATNWITNFAIVEINPIGIQNIGWRFWIVWTVLNAVFLPIIYSLYPETANRTLEDIDSYYRSDPALIVVGDPDATSARRPLKYIQREDEEIQRRAKEAQAVGLMCDGASVEHIN
ncbi:major facilitator superfamily domain-containing protein [Aspergillus aurantiobrunneus]